MIQPLRDALEAGGEPGLAESVERLCVHALCGCGDSFCGSFYTLDPSRPRLQGTIGLDGDSPFTPFAIDTSDDRIAFVEIINADSSPLSGFKRRHARLCDEAAARA
ncbi:MAG TPA: hypothetical protein VE596_01955 [Gaiellaceae bacterium]|nr:hypothetical protein [Gaiellaceae bacterium]